MWDKMMADSEPFKNLLIADVNCDGDGKDLCSAFGIKGFPTLKYAKLDWASNGVYLPENFQDYKGQRNLDAMTKFINIELGVGFGDACRPSALHFCTKEEKQQIKEFAAMTSMSRSAMLTDKMAASMRIEEEHKKFIDNLEARQRELLIEAEKKKRKKLKKHDYTILKSVFDHIDVDFKTVHLDL